MWNLLVESICKKHSWVFWALLKQQQHLFYLLEEDKFAIFLWWFEKDLWSWRLTNCLGEQGSMWSHELFKCRGNFKALHRQLIWLEKELLAFVFAKCQASSFLGSSKKLTAQNEQNAKLGARSWPLGFQTVYKCKLTQQERFNGLGSDDVQI